MADSAPKSIGRIAQISFTVLMLGLTALFVSLGVWQVQRLAEKEALIAAVEARVGQPATEFPPLADWPTLDAEALDFSAMSLSGTFINDKTVLVFTNLTDPKGQYGRAGYWVMAPLQTSDGGIVWINRGFVPEHLASDFAAGGDAPEGPVAIEGTIRRPEESGSFTNAPDFTNRREWVRDPVRLSTVAGLDSQPVAPLTLDMLAGDRGQLPQGGETQLTFSNRHLEYAGTWFLFALITPVMLGYWLLRQRRATNLAQKERRD